LYRHPSDEEIQELLRKSKTVAVVGLSGKTDRDSYRVAKYMQDQGYRIIPVNPRLKSVLGEASYPSLSSIPEKVDIVNVFRRSELVLPIVEEALQISPRAIWLQLGIVNEEAAERALAAGVDFVMDRCIKIEHQRLFSTGGNGL